MLPTSLFVCIENKIAFTLLFSTFFSLYYSYFALFSLITYYFVFLFLSSLIYYCYLLLFFGKFTFELTTLIMLFYPILVDGVFLFYTSIYLPEDVSESIELPSYATLSVDTGEISITYLLFCSLFFCYIVCIFCFTTFCVSLITSN